MGIFDRFRGVSGPEKILYEKMKQLGQQYEDYVKQIFPKLTREEKNAILEQVSQEPVELYKIVLSVKAGDLKTITQVRQNTYTPGQQSDPNSEFALKNKLKTLDQLSYEDALNIFNTLPDYRKSAIRAQINSATDQELYSLIRRHAGAQVKEHGKDMEHNLFLKLKQLGPQEELKARDLYKFKIRKENKQELWMNVDLKSAQELYDMLKKMSGGFIGTHTSISKGNSIARMAFNAAKKGIAAGQQVKDKKIVKGLTKRQVQERKESDRKQEEIDSGKVQERFDKASKKSTEYRLNDAHLVELKKTVIGKMGLGDKFCMYCGGVVKYDHKFCMTCGKPATA